MAARRVLVTVEEQVESLRADMNAIVLPSWVITAASIVPGGAYPSYAQGYYPRDNAFYRAWDEIARDRDGFLAWMERHVLGVRDHAGTAAGAGSGRMSSPDYSRDEIMTVTAARQLRNGAVCFVGIGLPSAACNLARMTHAPDLVLIYESGTVGTRPRRAAAVDRRQRARRDRDLRRVAAGDLRALPAARPHRCGLSRRGADRPLRESQQHRDRRLCAPERAAAGAGGAPEIATYAREVLVVMKQSPRSFVPRLDFRTSCGYLEGGGARRASGCPGAGPRAVITDFGVLRPHPADGRAAVDRALPGRERGGRRAATGWPLQVARDAGGRGDRRTRASSRVCGTCMRAREAAHASPVHINLPSRSDGRSCVARGI